MQLSVSFSTLLSTQQVSVYQSISRVGGGIVSKGGHIGARGIEGSFHLFHYRLYRLNVTFMLLYIGFEDGKPSLYGRYKLVISLYAPIVRS